MTAARSFSASPVRSRRRVGPALASLVALLAITAAAAQEGATAAGLASPPHLADSERRQLSGTAFTQLPAALQPEAVHFDASAPQTVFDVSGGVFAWQDVDSSRSSQLVLSGGCTRVGAAQTGSGDVVAFDGSSCAAYLTSDLPPSAWSSDPAAPFTAVWVGRLDGSSSGEQWLMGLVRRTGAGWTVRVCACKGRA
jgi:hypothetical protein